MPFWNVDLCVQTPRDRALLYPGDTGEVEDLKQRLSDVGRRIDAALARSSRKREEITLIAVTKTFPAETIENAWQAGLRDFGENYVQEFEEKFLHVRNLEGARFHLIGHLQSNKANKATSMFDCVQTVDSARLARRLNQSREAMGAAALDVMIEVKLSTEESKHGCAEANLSALVEEIRSLSRLRLTGLMTIPPFFDEPEQSRPYFVKLRELAEAQQLKVLSMGMSNDFEIAIEEGATHIRVGTALFGRRPIPVR